LPRAGFLRQPADPVDFGQIVDIDEANAPGNGEPQPLLRLGGPVVDDPVRRNAELQREPQLEVRDDFRPCPERVQLADHARRLVLWSIRLPRSATGNEAIDGGGNPAEPRAVRHAAGCRICGQARPYAPQIAR
jgi:hypothetical protein